MRQRKYSIDEIDRMRRAIVQSRMTQNVEEHLRTYMMNGTTVEELEAWVGKIIEEEMGRQKAMLDILNQRGFTKRARIA
jgi:methionine aminopeptidase